MSAMHSDTSPDLKVVGSKLKDILEVRLFPLHNSFTLKRISEISKEFIW